MKDTTNFPKFSKPSKYQNKLRQWLALRKHPCDITMKTDNDIACSQPIGRQKKYTKIIESNGTIVETTREVSFQHGS